MLGGITNIQETVKRILEDEPRARDNDRLLMVKIWAIQELKLRDPNFPFKSGFALSFIDGQFIDPESIRRARQKIQEKYPHLRGSNYKGRQDHSHQVRKEFSRYK